MNLLDRDGPRAAKLAKGLECLFSRERLRELGFSAWGKEASGRIFSVHKELKGECKDRAWLFPVALSDKIRGNGHTLKQREHEETLPLRVTEHWYRLPKPLTLEIVESHLVVVPGSWLKVTLLEQRGWTRWPPVGPSSLNHSGILLQSLS